jgi:hypothetical protein
MKRVLLVALLLLAVACSDDKGTDDERAERTTTTPPLHAEEDLTDGKHFGFVTALDPQQFRLVFDKAELFEGDAATDAAVEDGAEPTEGGFYVRNPDDRMNRVTLSEDIQVRLLKPCCELTESTFEDWQAGFIPDDRTFYGTSNSHYEITITDGKVTAVDEIYVP